MKKEEIQKIVEKQREYYKRGATISVEFRIQQLKKLYNAIKNMRMI